MRSRSRLPGDQLAALEQLPADHPSLLSARAAPSRREAPMTASSCDRDEQPVAGGIDDEGVSTALFEAPAVVLQPGDQAISLRRVRQHDRRMLKRCGSSRGGGAPPLSHVFAPTEYRVFLLGQLRVGRARLAAGTGCSRRQRCCSASPSMRPRGSPRPCAPTRAYGGCRAPPPARVSG